MLLLLQASLTELMDDEAYYWFYSTEPGIGYFDHPPMVAFFIRAGTLLIPGELGVRFFSVMASFAGILIIEQLLEKKDFVLYAALLSSILIAQLGGFWAVPDSPFLFFISVFLFVFKKFTEKPRWPMAMVAGLTAACILYSKYHGVLFLFFFLLGNTELLRKPTFYLALLICVLAYLPHVAWLVENDYPSFRYHFGDRNIPRYLPLSVLEYILGQIFILGPITSLFLFFSLFRYKASGAFGRSLKISTWGIFLFLFLFTFNGTIEANWSLATFWPLLIISHSYLSEHKKWRRIFLYTVPFSMVILAAARLYLVYDFTSGAIKLPVWIHHKKEWAMQLQHKANDLPVVFTNSYQKAAVYSFYSHSPAISLNNIRGRMNQYNLSGLEEEFQGKKIFMVLNWEAADSFQIMDKVIRYTVIDGFSSYSKLYFENENDEFQVKKGENLPLDLSVSTRFCDNLTFTPNPSMDSYISYHYLIEREVVFEGSTHIKLTPETVGKKINLSIPVPPEAGIYKLCISVQTGWLPPTFNSKKWTVLVW